MKPFNVLARAQASTGSELTLQEHDGQFYFKLNGRQLMSTIANFSELELARLACESIPRNSNPRILIGGLGFGYTLKGALELLNLNAQVEVAELFPEVIQWNRGILRELNGTLLEDPRVELRQQDVFAILSNSPRNRYDAILLDVDNGPVAFCESTNTRLYSSRGLHLLAKVLKPEGQVAFWSASEDRPFQQRLTAAGFQVKVAEVKSHPSAKRAAHRIYLARRLV